MPTTYLLLLANLGVMLLGFGTVGEYVGRIYLETKRRPIYIIEQAINVPSDALTVEPGALATSDERRLTSAAAFKRSRTA